MRIKQNLAIRIATHMGVALFFCSSGHAELVTNIFSGPINSIYTAGYSPDAEYELGQVLTCTIVYDLAAGIEKGTATGAYTNVIKSIWVDTGNQVIGGESSGGFTTQTLVENNSPLDTLTFSILGGDFGEDEIANYYLHEIWISFTDTSNAVFSDKSLPETLNLEDYTAINMGLSHYQSTEPFMPYSVMTSLEAVPEPATAMMLFFGGGIGFFVHRLRRWANR